MFRCQEEFRIQMGREAMRARAMLVVLAFGLLCGCVQTTPQTETSFVRPVVGGTGLNDRQSVTLPTPISMPEAGGY
jgi:hypothetical protein